MHTNLKKLKHFNSENTILISINEEESEDM